MNVGSDVERTLRRLWNPISVDADQFLYTLGHFVGIEILQKGQFGLFNVTND